MLNTEQQAELVTKLVLYALGLIIAAYLVLRRRKKKP